MREKEAEGDLKDKFQTPLWKVAEVTQVKMCYNGSSSRASVVVLLWVSVLRPHAEVQVLRFIL